MNRNLQASFLSLLFCAVVLSTRANSTFGVNESQTNVTCPGGSNGAINVSPAGGTGPYTYLWNDGDTAQNRTNLAANTYNVTIKDNAGATGFLSITITQPSPFIITRAITNEQCGGDSMGSVKLTVNGATPAYTYAWSNGATSSNPTGLYAQLYYVTITDAAGCTATDSANITQPVGIAITPAVTDASCGGANGSINITVQYGNPAYSYLWSDASTSQNRTGLVPGTYGLTVTDALGCTAAISNQVNELPGNMTINYSSTAPSCGGGSNGSINITSIIGSTGPYTYSWNNGNTNQSISGLDTGTYSVTVTSGTSCTASTTISLAPTANLGIVLHPVAASCYAEANGGVTTNVSGGVSPYTYNWGSGITTKDLSGALAGTYIITVTDHRGCQDTASATVTQPQQMITTTTATAPTCAGGLTGSISSSTTGGTTPYTYWWGLGVNTQNRTNVGGGNYNITVTDAQGCTSSATASVPDYIPLTLTPSNTNNVCHGGSTGTASVSVSNGWSAYTYLWNNGSTTQGISLLAAAVYTVTVTDTHACTATASATVTQPFFAITINSTITNENCFGGNTGSILLNVTNGQAPYSYSWNNGATSSTVTSLKAGNFGVTITDNSGCSATDLFTITQEAPIAITPTDTNVSCFAGANGSIHLSVAGGTAPFTYSWSDGYNKQNNLNIKAGTYDVTTTDKNGCTASATSIITEPAKISIIPTINNVSCFGGNNGWVSLAVTGGTSPYQYSWPGGNTNSKQTGLAAGIYDATITDDNGCIYNSADTVSQPDVLGATATVTNVVCNGGSTGAINLAVTGGTSAYTFNWADNSSNQNRSNLLAGTYIVTVTDQMNCSLIDTTVITQASVISISGTVKNATCSGYSNGTVTLNVSGGTPNYSYSWTGGGNTSSAVNLSAGTYGVTVTDQSGCTAVNSFSVTQPSGITISDTVTNTTCNGLSNGSITIGLAGGSPPYQFKWNDGTSTANRSGLSAASYVLTVSDNQNCSAINTYTVNQPAAVSIAYTNNNVRCNGGSNASIKLTGNGGTSPYTYSWQNGLSSDSAGNLSAGIYTITMNDANNCSASVNINLSQPAAMTVNLNTANVPCYGQASGSIQASVTGGTPPFRYNWGTKVNTPELTDLDTGSYTVLVTDSNSCSALAQASISQPSQITTSVSSVVNATCFGAANGSINITTNGGTPGYSFLWSNNTTQQNLTQVKAGSYTVIVTDLNNCTASSTVTIAQPAAIGIDSNQTNVSCYGGADGALTIEANGGNGGYTYSWNNQQTGDSIYGLTAARYVVTVTDVMSCSASFSLSVSQPVQLSVTNTSSNVSCNGGGNGTATLSATGGTSPYTYNWGNGVTGQNRNNLAAGSYNITVADNKGCTTTVSCIINQPDSITIAINESNYACSSAEGALQLSAVGGTGSYQYMWSDKNSNQNRNNLNPGIYTVTVTDSLSCSATAAATIGQIPALQLTLNKTDVSCFDSTNGSINLSISRGTMPFKYIWSNQSTAQGINNLVAGSYSVLVTDSNNCTATESITINQPAALQIENTVHAALCAGGNTGSISLSINGGTPGYSFAWNNQDTTQNLSGVSAGNYAVTVTDAHNCQASVNAIVVAQPAAMQIQTSTTAGTCAGSDAEITLAVTGGSAPYNFKWSNGSTSQDLSSIPAGYYSVTISDNNGCSSTTSDSVKSSGGINLSSSINNASCNGAKNGEISLLVTGGKPAYKCIWSNNKVTPEISNLTAGSYSVTVTDANNCTATSEYTVSTDYNLEVSISGQSTVVNGQPVQLTATANVEHNNTYSWTPADYLRCNNCAVTEASPTQPTIFTVSVTDMNGCKASDTITVNVESKKSFFIPNAFSPNKDGNNDLFHIYGDLSTVRFLQLAIFDRWGEKVFETNDSEGGWDGQFRGQPAAVGTYLYTVAMTFADGTEKNFQGSVNLFR